jgi:FkbM family methyltransferase
MTGMKKQLIGIIRKTGFDIVRYRPNAKKTVRTDKLDFYRTTTGNYYLPRDAHGDEIAMAIISNKVFDAPVYEIAKKYIRPDTAVLDIGSNFGQMAVLMSKLVGQSGVVHAFEADDFIFSILQKNIKENAGNIIAHFGAVHNTSKKTVYFPVQNFERFGTYGSYGIDYVNGKGRPVETITIDEIEYKQEISFVKIDIQGGDLLAMQGAVKTIEKYRMPILFEYEYLFEDELSLSFQEYIDFVAGIGYRFVKVINGNNYLILPKER